MVYEISFLFLLDVGQSVCPGILYWFYQWIALSLEVRNDVCSAVPTLGLYSFPSSFPGPYWNSTERCFHLIIMSRNSIV